MDNIDDDNLTNLSWLKVSNISELQSKVNCDNNHIDDDLQCLCWIVKMRPTSSSSHSLKRLSSKTNKDHPNRSLTADDNPTSRRILMYRTLSPAEFYQQSFILIRSSNGKISCLSIRHFV